MELLATVEVEVAAVLRAVEEAVVTTVEVAEVDMSAAEAGTSAEVVAVDMPVEAGAATEAIARAYEL